SGTASDDPSNTAASQSPTGAAQQNTPVADPDHAVTMPGNRTGALHSTDLLIRSQKTIPKSVLDKVRHTKGVSGVEPISLAEVSVEDRLVQVAAVDPSTYRNFAPFQSADSNEVWQRVAGGEIAVDSNHKADLPIDAKGFVKLGSKKDASTIHVGAYAPQPPGLVSAVVNTKWGEDMGMVKDNAIIVSTAAVAPDRVVKPIQQVVGSSDSVLRLDVVARAGLDPAAPQTANVVGSVSEAVGNYTYHASGSGGAIVPDPGWVSSHIVSAQVPIVGTVQCNKLMIPQLRAALQEVVDRGLASKIHTYSGCYNPRFIAGTSSLSNHAFGLAIDFDATQNARGTRGHMDPTVVSIFEKWGFTWGGTWRYTDPMHFEINRIVHPG
ncbi:MAG: M15 family metallopeptidase, partial [Nocardioides sp.]|nr:M15 family metallopeptidase [Nocardioides sp.]